jgi:hypothetical protein
MKSLELDGVKAADLKVRVEANERALDDLQKVQSKAGDIADKAVEATPEAMNAAAGKVDQLLEEGVSIANRKGGGRAIFSSAATRRRKLRSRRGKMPRAKSPRSITGAAAGWVSRNSAAVSR